MENVRGPYPLTVYNTFLDFYVVEDIYMLPFLLFHAHCFLVNMRPIVSKYIPWLFYYQACSYTTRYMSESMRYTPHL
jgi:hypothetical protein